MIHRGPVNSPHKWSVTREMFPFDYVIMLKQFWMLCDMWRFSNIFYHTKNDKTLKRAPVLVDGTIGRVEFPMALIKLWFYINLAIKVQIKHSDTLFLSKDFWDQYSGATGSLWHFKSQANVLFVQQFMTAYDRIYWPSVMGINWWPVVCPHKRPLMWKAFPCHGVIMS